MFSGIIEAVGQIEKIDISREGARLRVEIPRNSASGATGVGGYADDRQWRISKGESVCVNGVCLSAVSIGGNAAIFEASPETLEKTNLKILKPRSFLNLERAMKIGDGISGHFVTGHVDGTCILQTCFKQGNSRILRIECVETALIVEKGSIALNGISLTAFEVSPRSFKTAVIPHTWENTNLKYLGPGSVINIEFDVLGKYLFKKAGERIDSGFLKKHGFF
ncbi:MAG: riboflavin synthase [Elusimicrobia bacterium]|nr:riboflavin synthase [Elusimicrobiota bacterium]